MPEYESRISTNDLISIHAFPHCFLRTYFRIHVSYFVFQVETANPEVSVWVVNLSKPKYLFPVEIRPTASVEPGSYVTSASFFGDNNVAIVWLNRKQNTSVIVTCRAQSNFNCTDVSRIERENLFQKPPKFLLKRST